MEKESEPEPEIEQRTAEVYGFRARANDHCVRPMGLVEDQWDAECISFCARYSTSQ